MDGPDDSRPLVHEAGDAFTIKQLRRRAYRLMELLGLRRVRLYDARSSCFTFLADDGVPGHILARWAGRASVNHAVCEPSGFRDAPVLILGASTLLVTRT